MTTARGGLAFVLLTLPRRTTTRCTCLSSAAWLSCRTPSLHHSTAFPYARLRRAACLFAAVLAFCLPATSTAAALPAFLPPHTPRRTTHTLPTALHPATTTYLPPLPPSLTAWRPSRAILAGLRAPHCPHHLRRSLLPRRRRRLCATRTPTHGFWATVQATPPHMPP